MGREVVAVISGFFIAHPLGLSFGALVVLRGVVMAAIAAGVEVVIALGAGITVSPYDDARIESRTKCRRLYKNPPVVPGVVCLVMCASYARDADARSVRRSRAPMNSSERETQPNRAWISKSDASWLLLAKSWPTGSAMQSASTRHE